MTTSSHLLALFLLTITPLITNATELNIATPSYHYEEAVKIASDCATTNGKLILESEQGRDKEPGAIANLAIQACALEIYQAGLVARREVKELPMMNSYTLFDYQNAVIKRIYPGILDSISKPYT